MIRKNARWIIFAFLALFGLTFMLPIISKMIGGDTNTHANFEAQKPLPNLDIPKFDAESAYDFTGKILAIGPRITGTPGAQKVRVYIEEQFKKFGAVIIEQKFKAITYDGKSLDAVNIIARTNLQATKRILLTAHWDSREFADDDPDPKKKKLPVPGADDSGSAIGTLLEICRQLQIKPLSDIGVDFVLFDAEDDGNAKTGPMTPEQQQSSNLSWALGSQYWAKNLHVAGYAPMYGINLDMIGARGAHFPKEGLSLQYAPAAVDKIWRVGRYLGYTNYFSEDTFAALIDDHKYVNEIAHIPMVDIINLSNDNGKTFGEYHHTAHDDMNILDKETMKAVGQTILSVLHYEQANVL